MPKTLNKQTNGGLGLDRRQFLAGATAMTAGGLILPKSSFAQTPKKGGTLRVALSGASTSDSTDPLLGQVGVVRNMCYATYDTLIELSPEGEILPALAESWESNADATEWVFNVRKGVEFHNGKSLEAADVIYSINRHRGEDTASPMKALLAPITDVTADGKHKVRFKLSTGNADFAYYLNDYRLSIIPEGFSDWENPVGAGGYKLVNFDPGVSVIGERNPNYWKEGRAHVDSYVITAADDVNARVNGLITGEFDAINGIDRKIAALVDGSDGVNLVVTPGKNHHTCAMDTTTAPFDNNDVRLAMKWAVNRQEIVEKAFAGYGSVGNDHPIASTDPFFNSELPQRDYDPDKAAHHLKKAGLGDLTFELFGGPAAGSEASDTAQLIMETADAVDGLEMQFKRVPADGYWSDIWMNKPFAMSYWSGRPTADMMLSWAYVSTAKYNESRWSNATFDQLLESARAETNFATRKQMYWDMQELLHNSGGSVIYAFADLLDGVSDNVGGFTPDPVWDFGGGRTIDRVWLES